jgi:hypothetical protein
VGSVVSVGAGLGGALVTSAGVVVGFGVVPHSDSGPHPFGSQLTPFPPMPAAPLGWHAVSAHVTAATVTAARTALFAFMSSPQSPAR